MTSLKDIMLAHKGQFMSVQFVKKSGELRTINGQIGHKEGHEGSNTVAHIGKYITMVENLGGGEYQFRNVNVDTIQRLAVGGKVYTRSDHD